MIIKPAISWLNTDSDSELINDITVVILGVGGNPAIYSKPTPDIPSIQLALNNFSTGVAATADGGPSVTSKKNNLRLIVTGMERQLAGYVQTACGGDMTNLLLSGFPVQKPTRAPIGVLAAPSNPVLALGTRSGELDASVNPVFGASTYNWKLTSSVAGAPVLTEQTTASYVTFASLTPGATFTMTCYVVGAAGPSDWSKAVSQMAV
jgi:hypothetical protein